MRDQSGTNCVEQSCEAFSALDSNAPACRRASAPASGRPPRPSSRASSPCPRASSCSRSASTAWASRRAGKRARGARAGSARARRTAARAAHTSRGDVSGAVSAERRWLQVWVLGECARRAPHVSEVIIGSVQLRPVWAYRASSSSYLGWLQCSCCMHTPQSVWACPSESAVWLGDMI